MKQISVSECVKLKRSMQVSIVDIRDDQSYRKGHIPDACRVDNQSIDDFIQTADLDTPLIVCCYHGHSSISAALFFEQKGFEEVYSMDGGMSEWALTQPMQSS